MTSLEEQHDINKATLVSISEDLNSNPTSVLYDRTKPKSHKKTSKKIKNVVKDIKSNELKVISSESEGMGIGDEGEVLDLADRLLEQLDNTSISTETVQGETLTKFESAKSGNSQTSQSSHSNDLINEVKEKVSNVFKPNRQKVRMARKEAERNEISEQTRKEIDESGGRNEAQEESLAIQQQCEKLGLILVEMPPDGHCLYNAIADQLNLKAAEFPNTDRLPYYPKFSGKLYETIFSQDFAPFIAADEEAVEDDGKLTQNSFENYCHKVESTSTWGGQPEINALSKAYKVPIHVIQSDAPVLKVNEETLGKPNHRPLTISLVFFTLR